MPFRWICSTFMLYWDISKFIELLVKKHWNTRNRRNGGQRRVRTYFLFDLVAWNLCICIKFASKKSSKISVPIWSLMRKNIHFVPCWRWLSKNSQKLISEHIRVYQVTLLAATKQLSEYTVIDLRYFFYIKARLFLWK